MEMITSDHPSYWRYNNFPAINVEKKTVLSEEDKIKNNIYKMQQEKLKLFQSQNPEIGHFDVIFDFDGKLLYANKYVLVTSSETLNSWLSDRWTKDENPIKIETYTFDIFYQFCTFLYSGSCFLTKENIFQIIDAAEFFGVQCLKDFCEEIIIEKPQKLVNKENFFEMVKVAEKYSLLEFTKYLDYRLYKNLEPLIVENKKNFLGLSKSRIIALCKNQKESWDYDVLEEVFFKTICKWVENYVQSENGESNNKNFDYENAIKNEFNEIFPFFRIPRFGFDTLMEFAVKHGFLFDVSSDLYKILAECRRSDDQEQKLFETMYEIAEKKVLKKQKNNSNETFNEKDAIKEELSEFLPKIRFYLMDKKFLKDSVVAKGIISHYQAFEVIYVKG
uniref:BTB domain-containing protein n=1 Tax=Panagrolaimus davidi TaxID=227884 RepID=A0A914PVS3_9BILA